MDASDNDPVQPAHGADQYFMQNALTMAGLQHVVDNLCSETHQHMTHWASFYSDLKSLEAFLRVEEIVHQI
jgi:hypothetical protein